MPAPSALITALIVDQVLCVECIKVRSGLSPVDFAENMATVVSAFRVHERHARCDSCGALKSVLSLDRPAAA